MFRDYVMSDRMEYVRRKKSDECFFCRAVKEKIGGRGMKIYDSNDMMVIINIFPYTTGHLMVAPKRHTTELGELTERENIGMWKLVRKSILLLKKTFQPHGFNIGINIGGKVSGGSIEHLHMHIVPRYETDNSMMESVFDTKIMPQKPDDTYKEIMKNISLLS
jgi:ATP adenylyltransferase